MNFNQLNFYPKKIFILIGGGSASGKNHYASKLKYKLIDIDEINKNLNNGRINVRTTINKAINEMKKQLEQNFRLGKSIVHVTTASNFKGTENKFKLAKRYGYKTVFVNVKTTLARAILNNEKRMNEGGHGETIPYWKFLKTKVESEKVFRQLKKSEYIDTFIQIVN